RTRPISAVGHPEFYITTRASQSETLRCRCDPLWDASTVSRPTMGRLPSQLLPPQLSVIPKRPCAVRRHFRKRLLAGALQKMYSTGTHYRPPLRGQKSKRPIVGRSATIASHCGTLPASCAPLWDACPRNYSRPSCQLSRSVPALYVVIFGNAS